MRKIVRSSIFPQALRATNLQIQKRALANYYKLLVEERRLSRPPYDPSPLYDEEVRSSLKKEFQGRCAWCEQQEENLLVSHYRPRQSARFSTDGKIAPDYYGWFAYQWQNLILVCHECNRAHGNWFPLKGSPAPVLCTWSEAQKYETPLLLNPSTDNPCEHLTISSAGTLLPLTEKGRITLEVLQLNRRQLQEMRGRELGELIADLEQRTMRSSLLDYPFTTPFPGIALIFFNTLIRIATDQYSNPKFKPATNHYDAFNHLHHLPLLVKDLLLQYSDYTFPLPSLNDTPAWNDVSRLEKRRRLASQLVTNISMSHFKSFDNFSLDFNTIVPPEGCAPCVALVGENATGKSSILQAICLALMSRKQRNRLRLDYEDYLQRDRDGWHRSHGEPACITLTFDSGEIRTFSITDEGLAFSDENWPDFMVLAYGARRYFKPQARRSAPGKSLFYPNSLLMDVTKTLQNWDDEYFAAIARAMKEILSLDQDEFLMRDEHRNILVRAHGRDTPLSKMSDGYQSLFAMSLDIMCEMTRYWGSLESARGVVLIDEIETHLHPRWKIQVVTALRRAMPGVQFIFTTHDPLCLRGLTQREVRVLFRNSQQQVAELTQLPLLQGMDIEQLLTSDYFGLLSTLDGELENLLVNYNTAIQQSPLNHRLVTEIETELNRYKALSGSPAQQAIAEGIVRYVQQARKKPLEREKLHEDAVKMIVQKLQEAQR